MPSKIPQVASSQLFLGADVYAKPNDEVGGANPWNDAAWLSDNVTLVARQGSTGYFPVWIPDVGEMAYDTPYLVFRNTFVANFTTNYSGDANSILSASILSADLSTRVYFKGLNLPSGLLAGKPYWAINIVEGVSFEVEAVEGSGTPVDLGEDGSGSFTLASRRSASDFADGSFIGVMELEDLVSGDGETTLISDLHTWLAEDGRLDVIFDAILGDTGELQTDWTNGGRLDLILDTIASLIGAVHAWLADGGRLDLIFDAILAQVNLIDSGTLNPSSVLFAGSMNDIVIGDDYKAANIRAITRTFTAITGFNIGTATCSFGLRDGFQPTLYSKILAGSLADNGDGTWTASFEIDKADLVGLDPGYYDWSIEVTDGGDEVTIDYNKTLKRRVRLVAKQT